MSPSRPSLRVRPRSAIVDPDLARTAVTELPGSHLAILRGRGLRPRTLVRALLDLGRPAEPERVLVMPLATVTSPLRRR
jgi:hypothetical protein